MNDFSDNKSTQQTSKKMILYLFAWIIVIALWIILLKDTFMEMWDLIDIIKG